jgi:hypothetical protein
MNRMELSRVRTALAVVFTTRRAPSSRMLRLAAAAALTAAMMVSVATPASAYTFGSGWLMYGGADCYMAKNRADITVTVREPTTRTNGLYFVVDIYAKGQYEAQWTRVSRTQTGLVRTWSSTGSGVMMMNNSTRIASGSFSANVPGRFDLGVQYWTAAPGATSWSGPYFFQLKLDSMSSVTTYDDWGYAYRSIKDCYL